MLMTRVTLGVSVTGVEAVIFTYLYCYSPRLRLGIGTSRLVESAKGGLLQLLMRD